MKKTSIIAITSLLGAAGIGIYLFTRSGAAKAAGKRAIEVVGDCETIRVTDEAAASEALKAAGPIAFRGLGEPAIDLARRIFKIITSCELKPDTRIEVPGRGLFTGASIEELIGTRTVGDVLKESGLELDDGGASEATEAVDPWVQAFGEAIIIGWQREASS